MRVFDTKFVHILKLRDKDGEKYNQSMNIKVPIYDYSEDDDGGGLQQAMLIAQMPNVFHHIALMPDMHMGYGMPIGGVCAMENSISPNMVGKDIGCGVCCAKTNLLAKTLDKQEIVDIFRELRKRVPMGAGAVQKEEQKWHWDLLKHEPLFGWLDNSKRNWFKRSMQTLGGGKMVASSPRG